MTQPDVDVREMADHGLMFAGHDVSRSDALAAARTHLLAGGMSAFDAETATVDRPGAVVQAWWGGDDLGFVGAPNRDNAHHDPQPVTVVHVELPQVSPEPAT